MSLLQKNISANFGGGLWTGLMSLVFIPLYIRFLGIEAYGLIGIFAALLGIFSLLDMGLSNTLNREMASLSVQENKAQEMRDLLRTLEIPYWAMAGLISMAVVVLSPLIAYHWVNAQNLLPVSIQRAIILMGIATAFQWPLGFYSGGLMGLQRQVLLNVINVIMATCRGLGAVLVLWLISPTVEAFFIWQIIVSVAHTGLITFSLWRSLPSADEKPRFRRQLLLNIWRFAAGMNGITLTVIALTQTDKVILSRMLSLEMFGYYTLAGAVAGNLSRFHVPVFNALYPRFTQLVTLGDQEALKHIYHQGCQVVSVLIIPPALILAFFSREILLLWTQNPATADQAGLLVSLLIIGNLFNGLTSIPYALQLAHGWTKLAFYINILSILLLLPLMIFLVQIYGAVGAAWVWVILNASYVIFNIHVMHRRLLPYDKWRWYKEDIGLPLLTCLTCAGIFSLMMPIHASIAISLINLILVSILTLGITALATSVTRNWIKSIIIASGIFSSAKS